MPELNSLKEVSHDHISVCICTFKRPEMLSCVLESVIALEIDSAFSYEIVVVDNDNRKSAKETVRKFQSNSKIDIIYDCEPEQNISLARNRAIKNARGNLIAYMDDDEFPEPIWLVRLYQAFIEFSVDGVLGPVIPLFRKPPPDWLIRSRLCDRMSFATGTMLNSTKYMRTGNVLFCRKIIEGMDLPFDPKFGRTGGEDAVFFSSMLRAGCSFVWCNEAQVKEEVPKERQKLEYYIRRALIRGATEADVQPFFSYGTIKSLFAVPLYTLSLPFLMLLRYHLFVKYLIKDCDHIAKLFAQCGIKLVRERTFD